MPFLTAKPVSAGDRFGRLVVIRELESVKTPNGTVNRMVECRCDCGTERAFRLPLLRNGKTKSCGCLFRELAIERGHKFGGKKIHGGTGTPEYRIWHGMKARCLYPGNGNYERYGGRGIKVCDRWKDSFPAFLADMGPRPSDEHSIDREDNDGNYEPGNCRWATIEVQANNRSNNIRLEIDGRAMTVAECAEETGLSKELIYIRLKRGLSSVEAVRPLARKHVSDPFYRTPISQRDAAWYREYERREKGQP
jgi:hypothetical protein